MTVPTDNRVTPAMLLDAAGWCQSEDELRETLRLAAKALSAALAVEAGTVGVKPLKWSADGNATFPTYTASGLGRFYVIRTGNAAVDGKFSLELRGAHVKKGGFERLDAAKAAAQADYEARILSALTPASSAVPTYYCTDCETHIEALNDGRCPCGSGRVVAAPTSSAVEGEAVVAREAERLARLLHAKHYADVTQWKPLSGDVVGLITQIDNMVAGLVKPAPAPAGEWRLVPVELPDDVLEAVEDDMAERRSYSQQVYAADVWDKILEALPASPAPHQEGRADG